ncbi:MAG: hypothetical protein ACXWF8_16775 [Methylobacter sp.]
MTFQTYFGLDNNKNSWLLVQRVAGQTVFLRRFNNTVDGLGELAEFIRHRCDKPRLYIKSTGCSALGLLTCLCGIPAVEVVFVSEAGFKQYQTCLHRSAQTTFCEAETLADCAERMI